MRCHSRRAAVPDIAAEGPGPQVSLALRSMVRVRVVYVLVLSLPFGTF